MTANLRVANAVKCKQFLFFDCFGPRLASRFYILQIPKTVGKQF